MYEKYFDNAFIWTTGADEAIFFRASSATPAHSSVALAEPNQTDALERWVLGSQPEPATSLAANVYGEICQGETPCSQTDWSSTFLDDLPILSINCEID